MNKFKKLVVFLIIILPSSFVTLLGWDKLIVYFHGQSLGLWKTWVLFLAVAFLRARPFAKTEPIVEKPLSELFVIAFSCLVMDSIAVFWILPYVLGF